MPTIITYFIITCIVFYVYNFFISRKFKSIILGNAATDGAFLLMIATLSQKVNNINQSHGEHLSRLIQEIHDYLLKKYN